jgi:hypothetical protein
MARGLALAVFVGLVACVGTTGGQLVSFPAAASGPADAVAGQPLSFVSDMGWNVTLTEAKLHVGAMYLNQSIPVSGSQGTPCILPSTYVAQVTTGLDVDLLSPDPQRFPSDGSGVTVPPALAGQVWLTGGDVNTIGDPSPPVAILTLEGSASKAGVTKPFTGQITIDKNRQVATTSGAAGGDPICQERIVSPIPTSVAIETHGGLLLRVDPRLLFVNVNFGLLPPSGTSFAFSDDPTSADYTQPSRNLYANLHSASGLYTFAWDAAL